MGGGSSSPRTLTIENNDPNIIAISNDTAKRLTGQSSSPVTSKVDKGEMKRLEAYYNRKIEALERQNAELHKTTVEHFTEAVEQVEKKYVKLNAVPVCSDLQVTLMKCYAENKHQALNCSAEARAFDRCVHLQLPPRRTSK